MTWLTKKDAVVIGQGLTGTEGSVALPTMLHCGTKVAAGVTPGKGGTTHFGIPIFNTVQDAVAAVGPADVCVQFVPAQRTFGATQEAIQAKIPLVVIGAEKIPTRDTATLYAEAKNAGVQILGPSSLGFISTHRSLKVGFIGGANPERAFKKGNIAIVSKSGGMTSDIGLHLQKFGLGVSWAFGTGGERIICSDFTDILTALEADDDTVAAVVFGEFGGTAEERLAEAIARGDITKPVVAYIVGEFASMLPEHMQFGHAGAILEAGKGSTAYKKQVLREAGATIAEDFDMIGSLLLRKLGASQ